MNRVVSWMGPGDAEAALWSEDGGPSNSAETPGSSQVAKGPPFPCLSPKYTHSITAVGRLSWA